MHFGGGAPSSCLFPQSAGSKNELGHMPAPFGIHEKPRVPNDRPKSDQI